MINDNKNESSKQSSFGKISKEAINLLYAAVSTPNIALAMALAHVLCSEYLSGHRRSLNKHRCLPWMKMNEINPSRQDKQQITGWRISYQNTTNGPNQYLGFIFPGHINPRWHMGGCSGIYVSW